MLDVRPDAWRGGVGSALLVEAMRRLHDRGWTRGVLCGAEIRKRRYAVDLPAPST